jgi:signal transduction histidine kinase
VTLPSHRTPRAFSIKGFGCLVSTVGRNISMGCSPAPGNLCTRVGFETQIDGLARLAKSRPASLSGGQRSSTTARLCRLGLVVAFLRERPTRKAVRSHLHDFRHRRGRTGGPQVKALSTRTVALDYAVAVLTVSVASVGTYFTLPLLRPSPLALFFAAVMISGWRGGLGPGLLSTVLSIPISTLLLSLGDPSTPLGPRGVMAAVPFVGVSIVICFLCEARRRAVETERTRLKAILQQLPVGVAIADAASRRIILHNDEAERLLRRPLVSPNGEDGYPLLGAVHADGRAYRAHEYPTARSLSSGEVVKSETVFYPRSGSGLAHLSVNSAPIRSSEGRIIAAVSVFQDISELKRAESERTHLLRRLVTSQEEERRRIARELHDQMGQHLAALMLGLDALRGDVDGGRANWDGRLQRLRDLTTLIGQEVHRIALELRPTALDDLGLHSALQNYVEEWSERSRVEVDFHSSGLDQRRLDPQVETAVYRIVQEALTNVLKHARASHVGVVIEHRHDLLLLIVEDDGAGFEAEQVLACPGQGRMGLLGMNERVALVAGTMQVESSPGGGAVLLFRIPLGSKERSE